MATLPTVQEKEGNRISLEMTLYMVSEYRKPVWIQISSWRIFIIFKRGKTMCLSSLTQSQVSKKN